MWSPAWLIVIAAASLGACQGLSPQAPRAAAQSEPPVPSWRVAERVGESRYLSPSMAGWEQVVARAILPPGSQVSTGIGGRLILTQDTNQVSAGTSSRFILPGSQTGGSIRQTAGWLRYRIESAPPGSFGIETPFLNLSVGDAVVDVTVADTDTEVAVVSGRVHVKTLDERRQIDLHAGHVGYAGLEGDRLMLRRGPGLALERVPAAVIPALHPGRPEQAMADPTVFEGAADAAVTADQPAAAPRIPLNRQAAAPSGPTHGAALGAAMPPADTVAGAKPGRSMAPGMASPVARPAAATLVAMAGLAAPPDEPAPTPPAQGASTDPSMGAAAPTTMIIPASTAEVAATPAPADDADRVADASPAATPAAAVAPDPAAEEPSPGSLRVADAVPASQPTVMPVSEPADQVRRRFDLLTEGLLDGLSPAPPAMSGNRR